MTNAQNRKNDLDFDVDLAFSRSLGWLDPEDLRKLAKVRVGLAGVGGVGGHYAEILTRLGVHNFTIYDHDTFSIENTNRQLECKVSNYGKNKAMVISEVIKDINPKANVHFKSEKLTEANVENFCQSIDIYVDSVDFFETNLRIAIFRCMRQLGKLALTVAPLGTGASCVVFTPNSMSFDDYFGLHRTDDVMLRGHMFLLGLSPNLLHSKYMKDRTRVDFKNHKAPSLPMGVYAAANLAATTLLKLVLNEGKVMASPWSVNFDPYVYRLKKTYLWWGYRNPMQKIKYLIVKMMF